MALFPFFVQPHEEQEVGVHGDLVACPAVWGRRQDRPRRLEDHVFVGHSLATAG